jgi:hypothetical protein
VLCANTRSQTGPTCLRSRQVGPMAAEPKGVRPSGIDLNSCGSSNNELR